MVLPIMAPITEGFFAHASDGRREWRDFIGESAAVVTGSIFDKVLQDYFLPKETLYFSDDAMAMEAVHAGKAALTVMDKLIAEKTLQDDRYSDLEILPVPDSMYNAPIGAISAKQDIIDGYNAFLAEIEADGTLEDMWDRWLYSDNFVMPDIPLTGENGTLVAATSGIMPIWSFYGNNGELIGFEIENMRRFAQYLGMDIRFESMSFDGLIPYVASGKADIGAADISITEERKKSVLFTDSYFDSAAAIVAKKPEGGSEAQTAAPGKRKAIEDYAGAKIGIEFGDTLGVVAEKLEAGEIVSYATQVDLLAALDMGKVDAVILPDYALPQLKSLADYDLDFLEVPLEYYSQDASPIFHDTALRDRYNEWLAVIKADGVLDQVKDFWFNRTGLPEDEDIPHQNLEAVNGTLNVCDTGNFPPMVYVSENGRVNGFDIDMIERFAKYLGMDLNIITMGYDAIEPYVAGGKADMSACVLSKTPERERNMIFGDALLTPQAYLITKSGSDASAPPNGSSDRDYSEFFGKTTAIMTGSVYDATAKNIFGAKEVLYFANQTDAFNAVKEGKAEIALYDYYETLLAFMDGDYDNLDVIQIPFEVEHYDKAVFSDDPALIDKYNAFLEGIKDDGTLDEMSAGWLYADSSREMPDIETGGGNGVLTVATSGTRVPYSYMGSDGELAGFEIENAKRFAAYLGMDVRFDTMDFAALIPYVVSGKAQLCANWISVTPERAEKVVFSNPYFTTASCVVTKKTSAQSESAVANEGFIGWLKNGVQNNLVQESRWKLIADGLRVTLLISAAALAAGTALGCLLCFLLTRKTKWAKLPASVYNTVIHGLPMVVLLLVFYYIVFGKSGISPILVAIAAFALVEGANVGGSLKGAIDTVDTVQVEAARSIGFTAFGAFRRVTLPQAVKVALPGYLNGFVELVKGTAIVGYIAIQDLSRAGDIIRSRTYDAYFPILFVALVYFVITSMMVWGFKLIIGKATK
jgi:polar amino acid transport system substrate-binding protein